MLDSTETVQFTAAEIYRHWKELNYDHQPLMYLSSNPFVRFSPILYKIIIFC